MILASSTSPHTTRKAASKLDAAVQVITATAFVLIAGLSLLGGASPDFPFQPKRL